MMNKFLRFRPFFFILFISVVFSASLGAQAARPTQAILQDVFRLLAEFKYDEAIALFDTIDPAEAETTPMKLLKASVLSSAGRMAEAKTIAEAVLRSEPNNVEAIYVLSTIEGLAERTREQRTLLERIIRIDPRHVDALTDLGRIYLEAGQTRLAAQNFDRALEVAPNNLDALLGRARVYRLDRDPENSEALYNRAVTLYPRQADVYQNRGRLYRGMGFPIQALADFDRAKNLDPRDYWIAIDRANTLLDLNRKAEALEEFQRAIEIDPNGFLAYAYSAGIKDEFGDLDGAGRDFEMLSKLKPDYPYGFEGLGFHKMRRGEWAEAKDAFVETFRQLPDDWFYAMLAAVNWMRASGEAGPRLFLSQSMTKLKRDSVEWYLFRLFYDMSGRVYAGENDMIFRVDREANQETKARLLFYLAHYYDIRGNQTLANRYFLQCKELNQRTLPEWRLNEWILEARGIMPAF